MATIEASFLQVLNDFKKRLKPEEEAKFAFTTLKDLEQAANDLQEKQRKTKTARNLTRIQPFLQAMTQYKDIIEVFLNTSSILCFVWGPMKFMLLIASNWSKSFDTLLDTYKQLAENFPLLLQYRSMFEENEHMKKILVWIYEDILKFHLRALRVFTEPAWKQFFNATWKDFQESAKPILNDILRHRELIERKANLEQIQESRDARLQSQASFAALEKEQNRTKTLAVVSWLSAADAHLDHEAFSAARHDIPNTGSWILKESSVQDWLDPTESSVPVFWLNGIPGAGKTILASVLIDESLRVAESKGISLGFFYCRDQDIQRNRFPSVAKAILAQLLQQNPNILAYLYDECLKSGKVTLESAQDCVKILGTVLLAVPRTFIIIDGIDECEFKERKAILNFFISAINKDSNAPEKLRGLFVSQELSDIKTMLRSPETLRLNEDHRMSDIKNYAIKWSFRIQERFHQMPNAAREHIVKLVCEGADGMFLFAKLVLENLYGQQNLESVYKELHPDTFPHGFDQAYARIIKRILENPNPAQRRTARQLLGWITCAKRPLKWQEIQGATSIDVEQRLVNFEGRQLPDQIRYICGSLVDVLPGNRIQLVHTTARRYIIENQCIDQQTEEKVLAQLCLQYLTFECFDVGISNDAMRKFLMDGHYAFLDYASLHWNHHLETAIQYLTPEELCHSATLGIAINEFFEMHDPGPIQRSKVHEEYIPRCNAIETADCYEPLMLLLCHEKASRLAEEKLEALGPLGAIVNRVRTILEDLNMSQSLDSSTGQNLKHFYGDSWYKCSRHACYYFHEGFSTERGLSQHTDRHEKPFCCTEMGCTRMYIGWSTEKELKKHMSQYHPDPQAFAWKFPHVKKPPSLFQCELCPKQFTRANSLDTHKLREHAKERPFKCITCGKGLYGNTIVIVTQAFMHLGARKTRRAHIARKLLSPTKVLIHQTSHDVNI